MSAAGVGEDAKPVDVRASTRWRLVGGRVGEFASTAKVPLRRLLGRIVLSAVIEAADGETSWVETGGSGLIFFEGMAGSDSSSATD